MSQIRSIYTDAFIKGALHKHKKGMTQLADKACTQDLGNRWQMSITGKKLAHKKEYSIVGGFLCHTCSCRTAKKNTIFLGT